ETRLRTAELTHRFREIFFALRGLQRLFRLAERLLGAAGVDLVGSFHGFGENGNAIRENFSESPRKGKAMQLATVSVADLACSELGDQGSVSGQNPDVAVAARNLRLFGGITDNHFLGGNNFELESVRHLVVGCRLLLIG